MTTLADLQATISRSLRDTGNATWSLPEVNDLINEGIDQVSEFYPKEIVQTVGTVAAGVYTYSAAGLSNIFRLDIYSSAGSYVGEMDLAQFGGRQGGWQIHGGTIYLPTMMPLTVGNTLEAWGYGRYAQLSASTQTTDMDQAAIWAVNLYCQVEGFQRLVGDRVAFAQWQTGGGNSDISLLQMARIIASVQMRWRREQGRLRRMRKR